jgi:hypothetical protein
VRLALLVLLAGCSREAFEESDRAYGVGVDLGPLEDVQGWPLLVAACAQQLDGLVGAGEGGRLVDGARVAVQSNPRCLGDVPSCYWPDADLVIVGPDAAGLCHELKHRALERMGQDLDYGHHLPGWWVNP